MFGLSLWGKRTVGLGNKGEELETGVPAHLEVPPSIVFFSCLPTPSQPPALPPQPPPRSHTHTLCCSFSLQPRSPEEVTPHTHTLMLCIACRHVRLPSYCFLKPFTVSTGLALACSQCHLDGIRATREVDLSITRPSSEKRLLPVGGNQHRAPQPDRVQRARDGEHSVLKSMPPLHPSPQCSSVWKRNRKILRTRGGG